MNGEERIYTTSEVARELGISAMWLKKGEMRDYFPPARRDPSNGHRYCTRGGLDLLMALRARRRGNGR